MTGPPPPPPRNPVPPPPPPAHLPSSNSILPDHPCFGGIVPEVKQEEIDDVLACLKTPRPIQLEDIHGVETTRKKMEEIIEATMHPEWDVALITQRTGSTTRCLMISE